VQIDERYWPPYGHVGPDLPIVRTFLLVNVETYLVVAVVVREVVKLRIVLVSVR